MFETLDELGDNVEEYVNHLYLDDAPLYLASDLISGPKKCLPDVQKSVDDGNGAPFRFVKK